MAVLTPGKAAPGFSLKTTDGQEVTLAAALKNGPVLAAFFKVNCPTCQFTFPFLQRLYEAYGGDKVTFWGVSQNDEDETREFCKEFGVRFPMLIDARTFVASRQYGLTNVPSIFLISPDGKVKVSSVGFAKADIERISAEVARAASKSAAAIFRPGEVVPAYKPG